MKDIIEKIKNKTIAPKDVIALPPDQRYLILGTLALRAKEYKKAAETMEYAYSFQDLDCKSTVLSDLKMVRILSDYTYFLEKAKMYNKCIEVANLLVCIKPEFADPYLQLGDSYYHTNQKQKALDTYKTYSKIRIKQGQEKRIPKYVKKRIKELSR